MKINVLKVLIFNFLTLALSCHWREFTLSETLIKKLKFQGDAYFHYRDYKKFSRELKELYYFNIALIGRGKVESEREDLIKNYLKKWQLGSAFYDVMFIKKNIYHYNHKWYEQTFKEGLKKEFIQVKEHLQELTRLNLENKITYNVLKHYSIFYYSYRYIYYIMTYKNQFGDLKKYYSDFDILFVKEALAKTTKILIYHFPSLYNDLAYLFEEEADEYFK